MASELDIDPEEARIDILTGVAKEAKGHVHYKTIYTRKQRKDGSWHERIDIYEKYRRPQSKAAALLKKEGVEIVFHPRRK